MPPSLDNPRAKLGRAEEHLKALDKEARAFGEHDPNSIVRELDTRDKWVIYRIRVAEEPPVRLGLIFGDYLYNLRSALDNLVWQLVLLAGGTPGYHHRFLEV